MMADSGGKTVSRRPRRRGTLRRASRGRSLGASVVGIALASTALAACGSGGGTGPVTLNFYSFNDPSGAVATAVENCTKASGGKYTISYNKLPAAADDQRLQMARRLAAADPTMDILGLDVTWKGKLVAVPYNSNTQLLWYRSDLVPNPPKTWDEMISDAEQLAKQGKPHLIEIQGAQYEGVTVWFNTLVASAGGSILTPSSAHAAPGKAWQTALGTMKKLADSPAADPSLPVQMENENRLAMEAGTAAFELNYPFVYPSMKADKPDLFKHFKWALYPGVIPGQPARVTIGGIDLAVSTYSPHPDLAFQAALCLRNKQNQLNAAIKGGLPPTLESLYSDPAMFKDYPFHADILTALQQASVRPKTPAYQSVSIVISHNVSPTAAIDPPATEQTMAGQINDALQSQLVIP